MKWEGAKSSCVPWQVNKLQLLWRQYSALFIHKVAQNGALWFDRGHLIHVLSLLRTWFWKVGWTHVGQEPWVRLHIHAHTHRLYHTHHTHPTHTTHIQHTTHTLAQQNTQHTCTPHHSTHTKLHTQHYPKCIPHTPHHTDNIPHHIPCKTSTTHIPHTQSYNTIHNHTHPQTPQSIHQTTYIALPQNTHHTHTQTHTQLPSLRRHQQQLPQWPDFPSFQCNLAMKGSGWSFLWRLCLETQTSTITRREDPGAAISTTPRHISSCQP